jgi:TonB family protein
VRRLLLAALALSACKRSPDPSRDLDRVCAAAGEIVADRSLDPAARAAAFARRVDEVVESREVKNTFAALAAAAPADRWRLLQRGAAEVGRAEFACPPLETLLRPVAAAPAARPDPDPAAGVEREVRVRAAVEADGRPDVEEGLDPGVVAQIVRRGRGAIVRCYERALKGNPRLAGQVVLGMTVTANGRVGRVSVESSTVADESVGACMVGVARGWRFPPTDGPEVHISYPFVFRSVE